MGNTFVIAVFGISMVLAVAWIVTTGIQAVKRRRALEQQAQKRQPDDPSTDEAD